MSWNTPSSHYLIRNHQHPPRMDFEDRGFLTDSRAKIWHMSKKSHIHMINNVNNDTILQVPGQKQLTFSKHGRRVGVVLTTHLIML